MEVNEYLLAHKEDDKDDHTPPSVGKSGDDGTAKEERKRARKEILHLPRAESTRQRKSAAHSADSLAT